MNKGEKVFSFGEKGKDFWIVLNGSVWVLFWDSLEAHVDNSKLKDFLSSGKDPESFSNYQSPSPRRKQELKSSIRDSLMKGLNVDLLWKDFGQPNIESPQLIYEKYLGLLEGFGELALISKNHLRTATVIC